MEPKHKSAALACEPVAVPLAPAIHGALDKAARLESQEVGVQLARSSEGKPAPNLSRVVVLPIGECLQYEVFQGPTFSPVVHGLIVITLFVPTGTEFREHIHGEVAKACVFPMFPKAMRRETLFPIVPDDFFCK